MDGGKANDPIDKAREAFTNLMGLGRRFSPGTQRDQEHNATLDRSAEENWEKMLRNEYELGELKPVLPEAASADPLRAPKAAGGDRSLNRQETARAMENNLFGAVLSGHPKRLQQLYCLSQALMDDYRTPEQKFSPQPGVIADEFKKAQRVKAKMHESVLKACNGVEATAKAKMAILSNDFFEMVGANVNRAKKEDQQRGIKLFTGEDGQTLLPDLEKPKELDEQAKQAESLFYKGQGVWCAVKDGAGHIVPKLFAKPTAAQTLGSILDHAKAIQSPDVRNGFIIGSLLRAGFDKVRDRHYANQISEAEARQMSALAIAEEAGKPAPLEKKQETRNPGESVELTKMQHKAHGEHQGEDRSSFG